MSEPVRQAVYFSHDEIAIISQALIMLLAEAQKGHWRVEKHIEVLNDRVFDIDGFWVEPADLIALVRGERKC